MEHIFSTITIDVSKQVSNQQDIHNVKTRINTYNIEELLRKSIEDLGLELHMAEIKWENK